METLEASSLCVLRGFSYVGAQSQKVTKYRVSKSQSLKVTSCNVTKAHCLNVTKSQYLFVTKSQCLNVTKSQCLNVTKSWSVIVLESQSHNAQYHYKTMYTSFKFLKFKCDNATMNQSHEVITWQCLNDSKSQYLKVTVTKFLNLESCYDTKSQVFSNRSLFCHKVYPNKV